MKIIIRVVGPLAWKIGLWGVSHGRIDRSRIFAAALGIGGAWAFGRDA